MAKKNTGKKKTESRRSKSKKPSLKASGKVKNTHKLGWSLIKVLVNSVLLLLIVVATFLLVDNLFLSDHKTTSKTKQTVKKENKVFEGGDADYSRPLTMPMPPMPRKPSIAIIIDDMGYDRGLARKFIELDPAITFSMLPNSPHHRQIAMEANSKGVEVMLHLPMEPTGYPKANPGYDALLTSMTTDQMIGILNKHIEAVPHIVGVNNHMGSKMTTISTKMYQIFTILKKRDLFFIDSRTSQSSLCKPAARLLKIQFGERDVFLDHNLSYGFIKKQLKSLVKTAIRKGGAIGIAHPHKLTYEVLCEELPELKKQVRLVRVSRLVKPLG